MAIYRTIATLQIAQESGVRFGGAGGLSWETELMGATPAGARDARFYFLREHFLGGKQSI